MRNIQEENIAEHSHQVAVIAHALALAANTYFQRHIDVGKVVLLALYHDAGEVVIGDLRPGIAHTGQKGGFSYIWESHQAHIRNDFQLQLNPKLPAGLSGLCILGNLHGGSGKVHIS